MFCYLYRPSCQTCLDLKFPLFWKRLHEHTFMASAYNSVMGIYQVISFVISLKTNASARFYGCGSKLKLLSILCAGHSHSYEIQLESRLSGPALLGQRRRGNVTWSWSIQIQISNTRERLNSLIFVHAEIKLAWLPTCAGLEELWGDHVTTCNPNYPELNSVGINKCVA